MITIRASLVGAALLLALPGCWESDGLGGGSGTDPDGGDGTDDPGTDGTDTFDDVACADLSPCVESETYGYTCPGAVNGVFCWNLGSKCDATYLCANTSQACALVCGASPCAASANVPPHPQCN